MQSADPQTPQDDQEDNPHLEWLHLAQQLGEVWSKTLKISAINAHWNDKSADPYNLQESVNRYVETITKNPEEFSKKQIQLWYDTYTAWQETTLRFLGENIPEQTLNDRRFTSDAWELNPYFSFIKQAYLITSQWVLRSISDTKDLSDEDRKKLLFHTKQYMDALSPANFPTTNPEVIAETLKTGGENLLKGLQNLIKDLERGDGKLAISMTDYKDFEVGKNIANTPGQVVYQNNLMQLIQYTPTTPKVFKTPLLIIPPWINKFYILDLNEKKSFVRWLVEQGHSVFLISWINPNERHKDTTWEDYMFEGGLEALKQIEKITGERQVNAIGYCIGGTMLSTLLAWMHKKKEGERIKSATFLTTMIDFSKSGDMQVFIDEEQIELVEDQMNEQGFLNADYLKTTFSMMRANDLIWSFVINNYLMGKEPFAFDLLYWNDDSTNLSAKTHSFYLRNMYLRNRLIEKNTLELGGETINIRDIKTPSYFLSTETDHIAPWITTYTPTSLFSGPVEFTLGASGHIAGVVNPPESGKYCHWKNDKNPADPLAWKENATQHNGSWWPDWQNWISKYTGEETTARDIKDGIEPAPGSYVKVRS